jgi:hypothetical protein
MDDFCDCKDYKKLKKTDKALFRWNPPYGWVLSWMELTTEKGYTQVHRYGISVRFCPMCGRKANADDERQG